jgi:hypothetical protein
MCRHRKAKYGNKHGRETITDVVSVSEKELREGRLYKMYEGRKERKDVVEGTGFEVKRG